MAHELTHAVTERESNLIYWGESGAINEALSDIFGEIVDQGNSGGNDAAGVRWLMGEDAPGGAIRSMSDPTLYGDPDRRFSTNWYTGAEDNRGVHFNSGVANKLAYLLSDGGSFNGQTVASQGTSQVARLFYEANVSLLVPASGYFDLYAVLRQAARNLGWTPAAREALERACRAVQIDLPSNPTTVLSDGFEGTFPGSWQIIDQGGASGTGLGTRWGRSTYRKAGGTASAWCAAGGTSPSPAGGPYKPLMDTWMVVGPFSLSNTTKAWAEFDLFLDVEYPLRRGSSGGSPRTGSTSMATSSRPGRTVTPPERRPCPASRTRSSASTRSRGWWASRRCGSRSSSSPTSIQEYEGAYVDNVVLKKSPTQAPFGSLRLRPSTARRAWRVPSR